MSYARGGRKVLLSVTRVGDQHNVCAAGAAGHEHRLAVRRKGDVINNFTGEVGDLPGWLSVQGQQPNIEDAAVALRVDKVLAIRSEHDPAYGRIGGVEFEDRFAGLSLDDCDLLFVIVAGA